MRRQQIIDQMPDLVEVQFSRRMRVQHGGVINMFSLAGQQRFNRQLLDVDIGLHQSGEMRRQMADFLRVQTVPVNQARYFHASVFR